MILVFPGALLDSMAEWKYIIHEKVVIFHLNLDSPPKDTLMKKKTYEQDKWHNPFSNSG